MVFLPAPILANTRAAVTPMNPKKGAEVGQFSVVDARIAESMVKESDGGDWE